MSDDGVMYTSDLELPAGAVVQNSVMVVGYFDADGGTRYGIRTRGEATVANVLGLLELAKAHILEDQDFGADV